METVLEVVLVVLSSMLGAALAAAVRVLMLRDREVAWLRRRISGAAAVHARSEVARVLRARAVQTARIDGLHASRILDCADMIEKRATAHSSEPAPVAGRPWAIGLVDGEVCWVHPDHASALLPKA